MPLHVALHDARHVLIEWRQDLIKHLDQGDFEPAMHEVLGRFEADESAADDHRAGTRPERLEARVLVHPGEEQGTAFDPLADRPRIGHGAHLEDSGQVDSRQGRADRQRARRQHELVVGLSLIHISTDVGRRPLSFYDAVAQRLAREELRP